jgi:hypothetical protein
MCVDQGFPRSGDARLILLCDRPASGECDLFKAPFQGARRDFQVMLRKGK